MDVSVSHSAQCHSSNSVHANIKFKGRLVKSASETLSALQQVYGDTARKKSTVYDWFSRFKNRQETLEDDRRSGRPSTFRTDEMIEKVRQMIQRDRRMTIVELEQEVDISHGPINAILSDDLKMGRVSAKFVKRQLTTDQMECHMIVAGKTFLLSRKHRTLRISFRAAFGCSLLRKWASRGRVSQPWRTSNRMRRPNTRRFQKKPSAGASNNGKIDGASVCARKGPTLKVIR